MIIIIIIIIIVTNNTHQYTPHHSTPKMTYYTNDDDNLTDDQKAWVSNPDPDIPEPTRLVMFQMRKCYLCGDVQTHADTGENIHEIFTESVGEHPYGYRMCNICKPRFRKALFKRISPIWRFRLQHERDNNAMIWVARTRRDEYGNRIRTGSTPYTYSPQWNVCNWVTRIYKDKLKLADDPTHAGEDCVTVENRAEQISKLVSVKDLFIINYGSLANSVYNPNDDDPLNLYTDGERDAMFAEAVESAIFE